MNRRGFLGRILLGTAGLFGLRKIPKLDQYKYGTYTFHEKDIREKKIPPDMVQIYNPQLFAKLALKEFYNV